MLRRLFAALGYEPSQKREPESVRLLKRMAEQLNDNARRFREAAGAVVMLEQRVGFLETERTGWAERVRSAAERDPELATEAARLYGRIEGQLTATHGELRLKRLDERELRHTLTTFRKRFADAFEELRDLGHDVSECLLYIDLSRPDCPADETLLADEDRAFVARVIDGPGLH